MISKRKMLGIVALMLVFTIACVSFTIAYLSDQRKAENVFTMGEVTVELHEPKYEKDQTLTPGQKVDKDPYVENTGSVECFVRVNIAFTDTGVQGRQNIVNFLSLSELGEGWQLDITGGAVWGKSEEVTLYYTKPLEVGKTTPAVFTDFTLKPTDSGGNALLEGAYNGFDIVVVAEAVQTTVDGKPCNTPQEAFDAIMP